MKDRKRKQWLLTAMFGLVSVSLAITGCSKSAGESSSSPGSSGVQASTTKPTEPISLTLSNDVNIPPNDVDAMIVQPVKKKFPYITLNVVNPTKGNTLPELVAAGQVPDIIFGGFYNQSRNDDLGIIANIDDMVKQSNVDMSKFPTALVDTFKLYEPHTYALPLYMNIAALYYNKDIFDKFGIPYPKDDLSWDAAIDLGKKLTRSDGGVNYIGFYPGSYSFLAGQFDIPRVDIKTMKAVFNTPDMVKVFQTLKNGNDISGTGAVSYSAAQDMFVKDKTLAMFPFWMSNMVGVLEDSYKNGNRLNWDIAVQPTFKGVNSQVDAHYLMLTTTSKYKKQAFDVIKYLSYDQESQLNVAKYARIPVLNDPNLLKNYGASLNSFKGKHYLEVLTKNKLNKSWLPTKYDNTIAAKYLSQASNDVLVKGVDINTALQAAVDNTNRDLAAAAK